MHNQGYRSKSGNTLQVEGCYFSECPTITPSYDSFRRKYRRLPLSRILSLERLCLSLEGLLLSLARLWSWNSTKYFSAQLYCQKPISHLMCKSFQLGQPDSYKEVKEKRRWHGWHRLV